MNEFADGAHRVVTAARAWLGTPYRHQASLFGIGCDCLGLVRGIWRQIEGEEPEPLPPYSGTWAEAGGRERLLETAAKHFSRVGPGDMSPGDVIIFRLRRGAIAKHCGVLCGADHFIHAYDGSAVVESALTDFWRRAIAGVFRFPSIARTQVN